VSRLRDLLAAREKDLAAFFARHGGRVLRYESVEDLVQGFFVRSLQREKSFRFRGEKPFLEWLYTGARQHLGDRYAYWAALRRSPASLVRLTRSGSDGGAAEPAADGTGPATHADRRLLVDRAIRALSLLDRRDQAIVRNAADGLGVREQAEQLGLSREAAKSAVRRATDRFRKLFARIA